MSLCDTVSADTVSADTAHVAGRRLPSVVRDCVLAGRFRLRRRLGYGAMSEVWLAHDRSLDRRVAVKLQVIDSDPRLLLSEARSAASLAHPNIAAVYDYGESAGLEFLVAEYLCGGTLQQRLVRCGRFPDALVAQVARDIAAGLAHAHAHGVVHRDVKPSNVVFDVDDRAKLADFGLASVRGRDPPTCLGAIVGTAAYISPEQAAGRHAKPTSDVYSFGVLLFQMLTGELPFSSDSPDELVRMHIAEDAPAVHSRRADAPLVLAALADAALARDAQERPSDGGALVRALVRRRTPHPDEVVVARSTGDAGRPLAAVVSLVAVGALGFGLSALLPQQRPRPPAMKTGRHVVHGPAPAAHRAHRSLQLVTRPLSTMRAGAAVAATRGAAVPQAPALPPVAARQQRRGASGTSEVRPPARARRRATVTTAPATSVVLPTSTAPPTSTALPTEAATTTPPGTAATDQGTTEEAPTDVSITATSSVPG